MKIFRLVVNLSLVLIALFTLSCQSWPGSFLWRPGQRSSDSVPASPSDSTSGAAASLGQVAGVVPASSTDKSKVDKEIVYLNKPIAFPQIRHLGGSQGPFSENLVETSALNQTLGPLSLLGLSGTTGEVNKFFGESQEPFSKNLVETSALNQTLGLLGLPGLSRTTGEVNKFSDYKRAQTSYNSNTDIYNRNPYSSYGRQSSNLVQFNSTNLSERLLQQAVSAGSWAVTSWTEGYLSGYGKVRLNLNLNLEGHVIGSGDFLLPLYDTKDMTMFSQFGLRSMGADRVIGNFGLGRRFFLNENLAFGYNGFMDYDLKRSHSRGGIGIEGWYDWLQATANYYRPLSGWKNSEDYDSTIVEERTSEGWDARLIGYLPFYRNLAVKTAFEQWYGNNTSAFSQNDYLNGGTKVWSAGFEWTPVPLFSVGLDQRYASEQLETKVGLTFNYYFDMPLEDQLRSEIVADLRTVEGSRHEFVNRQYDMLLEYRLKKVEVEDVDKPGEGEGGGKEEEEIVKLQFIGKEGYKTFVFKLKNKLDEVVVGQVINVKLLGEVTFSYPDHVTVGDYTTNDLGEIRINITPLVLGLTYFKAVLTVDKYNKEFVIPLKDVYPDDLFLSTPVFNRVNFITASLPTDYSSTAKVTAKLTMSGEDILASSSPPAVKWSVISSEVGDNGQVPLWWANRNISATNGLTWGANPRSGVFYRNMIVEPQAMDMTTYGGTAPVGAEAELTDIVGSRKVVLEAEVEYKNKIYKKTVDVNFGLGPLSVFGKLNNNFDHHYWMKYDGTGPPLNTGKGYFDDSDQEFDFVNFCGGTRPETNGFVYGGESNEYTVKWPRRGWSISDTFWDNSTTYYPNNSKLPHVKQLQAVSAKTGLGAAATAGWTSEFTYLSFVYFAGELSFNRERGRMMVWLVELANGKAFPVYGAYGGYGEVCLR